jgi:hypothetical protein
MDVDNTRRDLLRVGGLTLLGGVVAGCATATGINPAVPPLAKVIQDSSQTGTTSASAGASVPLSGVEPEDKPTFVPESRDPVAYSRADNLFWNDQLMEHVIFFQMMMAGPELDGPRKQAAELQRLLATQIKQSSGIDASNYIAFNRRSIDLAKRVSDYKKTMGERQASGKMGAAWSGPSSSSIPRARPTGSQPALPSITAARSNTTAPIWSTSGRRRWASIQASSRICSSRPSIC